MANVAILTNRTTASLLSDALKCNFKHVLFLPDIWYGLNMASLCVGVSVLEISVGKGVTLFSKDRGKLGRIPSSCDEGGLRNFQKTALCDTSCCSHSQPLLTHLLGSFSLKTRACPRTSLNSHIACLLDRSLTSLLKSLEEESRCSSPRV